MPDFDLAGSFTPVDHDPWAPPAPFAPDLSTYEGRMRNLKTLTGLSYALGVAGALPEYLGHQAFEGIKNAVTLPYDVMTGRQAVTDDSGHTSPELIARATNFAQTVTGMGFTSPAEANALGMGIRAYHGTPHDFDQFKMEHVGTGEGAQVYGHGLYFAESPQVATNYRAALSQQSYGVEYHAKDIQVAYGLKDAVEGFTRDLPKYGPTIQAMAPEILSLLRAGKPVKLPTPGHLYEVDINAHPDHFLDWDKPLSEQSPQVQQAIKKLAPNPNDPNLLKKSLRASAQAIADDRFERVSGSDAHDLIGGILHPEEAGQNLAAAGIPGIRYLDQGSRTGGTGTHNYVVFDDKLINVTKKNGVPLTPVEHDPFAAPVETP